MTTTQEQALVAIRNGGLDWLVAVPDDQRFECGLCEHRTRGFDGYVKVYAAARQHLAAEHVAGVIDILDAPAELDEEDDRCQPIGCDNGVHLPGCRYVELDDPRMCTWFLACENLATGTRAHPVLGQVPCCDRCAAIG